MVEQLVPAGKKVFAFETPAASYTTRDLIIGYQSAAGERIEKLLWTPLIPEYPARIDFRYRLPGTAMRKVRVRQTAAHSEDSFWVSEMRLYHRLTELPRDADWRLRAWPNPWGVRDAFDNSPLTRWVSGERLSPRMFIEVELAVPHPVDTCRIQLPDTQGNTRMVVDWEDASGKRGTVKDFERTELAPPLGMRKEAMRLVKEAGIDYLLIHRQAFGWQDYHENQDRWGIDFLSSRHGAYLYAIR
jgi:hypothetical protein